MYLFKGSGGVGRLVYVNNNKKNSNIIRNFILEFWMKNILNTFIYMDAPVAWGIYFQDSATPQMEGLVELHELRV